MVIDKQNNEKFRHIYVKHSSFLIDRDNSNVACLLYIVFSSWKSITKNVIRILQ